ncbi:hypothetical protein [Nocardia seriolae]|uniref:hypothetical protein n=1 Tax=Nocardia seriolae TaxID=37332 RepID=UPI0004ACB1D7|nr:hypothetical protein [Nocardia seriolae]MTJ66787.1 hypothetical protein [Nocardia seriolae]MTJ70414.1 hypothetical protein [Nocardia seriolae]MTJ85377.1 hypothetical protein [Nocardia seriolae]MTK29373.1 hypothetical protein [Nocardia seriolae]MTK44720.1 hypothetical protein [Nocardia seriolae]
MLTPEDRSTDPLPPRPKPVAARPARATLPGPATFPPSATGAGDPPVRAGDAADLELPPPVRVPAVRAEASGPGGADSESRPDSDFSALERPPPTANDDADRALVPEPDGGRPERLAAQPDSGPDRDERPDRVVAGLELPPSVRVAAVPVPPSAESGGDREPTGRGGLSAAAESVVMRWNPHGFALLCAVAGADPEPERTIALVGGDESHAAALRVELARFRPQVDFTVVAEGVDAHGDRRAGIGERFGADRRPYSVALVVLDAGALIGAELVGRVRELLADGTRIVFALDGIHAHREWRKVRKLDAELLAEVGGGEEIVPVSARMAAVGRGLGDAALVDRSGVGLLHARLVAAVGAGAVGDQVGIVRERVVAQTRRRIEAQAGKVREGADVAVLREERARLLAVNDGGRGSAMAVVRNRLQLARVDLLHEVGARIRGLHTELRGEIDGLQRGAHANFPCLVSESVEKLTRELDATIRCRIGELCRQVEESVAGEWHISFPPPAERVARAVVTPGPRLRGVEDHLVIALGASAGFGLGRLAMAPLALLRAFDYAIMPVGLLLGAAVASWVVRARRHLAEGAHLRQWVADRLVDARAELEQRVATALVDVEERLTDEVLGSATARLVETDLRVGELEAQLRQAAVRRPALLQACERDLAALEFA